MRSRFFHALFWLLQWTWGILQNVTGLAVLLLNARGRHYLYNGAVVTVWRIRRGSMSLGMFIFLSEGAGERTLVHEFGHSVQSVILGPLYLLVIGLPSLLWCGLPMFCNYRKRSGCSYYTFYPERWADWLGEKVKRGRKN